MKLDSLAYSCLLKCLNDKVMNTNTEFDKIDS